jgi:hypothetical protein
MTMMETTKEKRIGNNNKQESKIATYISQDGLATASSYH